MSESLFGQFVPEFSAEYDLKLFFCQKKVEYPVEKTEVDEMEGNL